MWELFVGVEIADVSEVVRNALSPTELSRELFSLLCFHMSGGEGSIISL